MPNHLTLDRTFQALADPTRRGVLERLTLGPATVTELAEPFDMALPSFLQHLRVLEQSELVRSEKVGRVRTYRLEPQGVVGAASWLQEQFGRWEQRLDQLDRLVKTLAQEEKRDENAP